ncbi:DUF5134 domain-containing protein [Streptomyces mirabilis]|uniref:DUF5134 domain-containing protein n=3 Tax=Streptomyces TaxID=1883 RepID=UPI0039A66F96
MPQCHGVLDGTAMARVMAVLPWNRGPWLPRLRQTAFFSAAALWVPLTAAGCCQRSRLSATARRVPYAVGMAAIAWMKLSMAGLSHETLAPFPPVRGGLRLVRTDDGSGNDHHAAHTLPTAARARSPQDAAGAGFDRGFTSPPSSSPESASNAANSSGAPAP